MLSFQHYSLKKTTTKNPGTNEMFNNKRTVKKNLVQPLSEMIYIITKNDPYEHSTATWRNTSDLILCKNNIKIINTMITGK